MGGELCSVPLLTLTLFSRSPSRPHSLASMHPPPQRVLGHPNPNPNPTPIPIPTPTPIPTPIPIPIPTPTPALALAPRLPAYVHLRKIFLALGLTNQPLHLSGVGVELGLGLGVCVQ